MNRVEFWTVTVHFWPDATKAGVEPVTASWGELLCRGEAEPSLYQPCEFHFANRPTREEFLQACREHLPWTSVFEDTLFPILVANQWPLISWGRKAGDVDLQDDQGRTVGRISIHRDEAFQNTGYSAPFITYDEVDAIVNRLPVARRDRARQIIRDHEHLIRERYLKAEPAAGPAGQDESADVRREIRRLLTEHGIMGKKQAPGHRPDEPSAPQS